MRHVALKTLVGKFVTDFETNPRFQYHFHLVMMVFWILNLVVGTIIVFMWPRLWVKLGIYYVFLVSIYANWDTDYDAVSASLAYQHAQQAHESIKEEVKDVKESL